MNPQKRAQQVEKAALKAAQKAQRKHPNQPVTREELLQLRIQATPTWMRILVSAAGLILIGLGVVLAFESLISGGLLIFFGAIFLVVGIIGRRETVESCVEEIGFEVIEVIQRTLSR